MGRLGGDSKGFNAETQGHGENAGSLSLFHFELMQLPSKLLSLRGIIGVRHLKEMFVQTVEPIPRQI
jgi:hypothetical protein